MKFMRHKAFKDDPKIRYKMFKAGKTWVFTAIASFSLLGAGGISARADTSTQADNTSKVDATSAASEVEAKATDDTPVVADVSKDENENAITNNGSLSTGVDGGFMWNFVHLRTGFLFFTLILNSI